jgi:hypothetical protein
MSSKLGHDPRWAAQETAEHLRMIKDLAYVQTAVLVLLYNKLPHLSIRFLVISPSLRPLL